MSLEEIAGRLTAALGHLDDGRIEAAREEIQGVLAEMVPGGVPPDLEAIDDGELDRAFANAEAESDQMVSVNDVAAAVLRRDDWAGDGEAFPVAEESPFRTRTVATLLEQQGHDAAAEQIRARLAEPELSPAARARVVATLERWLDNLGREATR